MMHPTIPWHPDVPGAAVAFLAKAIKALDTDDPEILLAEIEKVCDDCLATWSKDPSFDNNGVLQTALCARGMLRFHLAVAGARARMEQEHPEASDELERVIKLLYSAGRQHHDWEMQADLLAVHYNRLTRPW